MPIDPRIALGTTVPQMRSPLQTLGALGQLREQQDQSTARQLAIQKQRQAFEDDGKIKSALMAAGNNPDDAVDTLYRAGEAGPAATLSKSLLESRKAKADGLSALVKTHKDALDFAAQIAQSATDQQSWDTAYKAMDAVLSPVFPQVMQQVPKEYDPKVQKQLVDYGTTVSDKLKSQQDAIANAQKAWDLSLQTAKNADERAKNKMEAGKYWTASASNLLSTAGSQDDWDNFQRLLAQQGAPPDVLASFGNQWSPTAAARAHKLGMTAAEEDTAAHQQKDESLRQEEVGLQQKRLTDEEQSGAIGPKARALTPNEDASIERWKANQFRALEQEYRGGATADPTAPLKLDDATKAEMGQRKVQIENEARAQKGMPSLFEAEHDAAAAGDQLGLRKVRNVYRSLTGGQDTPLEQMQKLADQIKKERDPAKAKALVDQLAALRASYGQVVNR